MQLKRELNIKPKHLRIILLVMVVIMSLLLIINAFRIRNFNPETPELSNETPQLAFLPLEDNMRVDFPGARIQIPEGWTVTALLSKPDGTGYKCVGTSCRVAVVAPTDEKSRIVEVVLSTPSYVRVEPAPELEKSSVTVNFAGENISLSTDKIVVNKVALGEDGSVSEGEVESEYVYQLYGCHSKEVCIYATYLSDNPSVNFSQVGEIKQLLSKLTIN